MTTITMNYTASWESPHIVTHKLSPDWYFFGKNVGRIRQTGLWQRDSSWKLNSKRISGDRILHAVVADFRTVFIMGPSEWEWPFLSDPPLPFTWSMESVLVSATSLYLTPLSTLRETRFSFLASQVNHLFFRPEVLRWKRSTYPALKSLYSLDLTVKLNSWLHWYISTVTSSIKFIKSRLQIYKLGAELLRRKHTDRWTF
jgi:hypothetical protein